jgi:hypothetical protein
MIAEIQPSAYQVPDNALWNIAGYVLTVLIAGFSGYKWGLKSQIYGKKLEIKTSMLPLIEKFIIRANGDRIAWISLRPDSIGLLFDPAIKLKSLLTGCKRKRLINAGKLSPKQQPKNSIHPNPARKASKQKKCAKHF